MPQQRRPRSNTGTQVSSWLNFTPQSLAPVLWLDAADTDTITSSAGLVSQWSDKSGTGNHVVQATSTKQPTTGSSTVNNLNAIDFARQDDTLVRVASSILQPFTVFAVALARSTSGGNNRYLDGYNGSFAARSILLAFGNSWRLQANTAANTGRGATLNAAKQQAAVFNGATSSFYENGIQYGGNLNIGTGGLPNLNISTDSLVANNSGTRWNGLLCEMIIAPRSLQPREILTVQQYLATKWGL